MRCFKLKYEEIISHLTFTGGELPILSEIHIKYGARKEEAWERYLAGDDSFKEYLDLCADESGFSIGLLNLYFYLLFGEYTYEECKSRGIPDENFLSIMNAYPAVSILNFNQTKEYGFSLPIYRSFLRRYVGAKLFFLERLEFELCESPLDFEIEGRKVSKGETVLNVHIPRDLPFNEEICEKSYARAKEFFRKHYGIETPVFICHSWMCDPWLEECLSESSAILNFQRKFAILQTDDDSDDAIGWIFGKKLDNINDYAEDTTIRRAAKKKLLEGERIGTALGARL